MTRTEWLTEAQNKAQKAKDAIKIAMDAKNEYNNFMNETLGVADGQQADLMGLSNLVIKILEMEHGKSNTNG